MTDAVVRTCRALAHPVRLVLLRALAANECDVGHLGEGSALDQPTVSKHLAALRRAGLVSVRIDGRRRCYSLANGAVMRPLLVLLERLHDDAGTADRP